MFTPYLKYCSYVLLIFLLFSHTLLAQNEANIWYFGHQLGLDFTDSLPKPLLDGKISSIEGSASIADVNGDLLFYTEGMNVWNKNHQLMPRGTGLKGHWSSTQSAIIVPKPGDISTYYIFTTDEAGYLTYPSDGLNYSEVNMCLEDGLGDVVEGTKNTFLRATVTEKLAATKHENGIDYWVITHELGTNRFLAYLVTAEGVNSKPVISATGVKHSYKDNLYHAYGEDTTYYAIGQMKMTPDGRKLGVAILDMQYLGVFDFNPATGKVSNPIEFTQQPYYTFELSPDGTKLYTNHYREHYNELREATIYQYDLEAGSGEEVKNSQEIVFKLEPEYFSEYMDFVYTAYHRGYKSLRGFQMGKDGRIYVLALARTAYPQYTDGYKLGVIEHPNLKGKACKFTPLLLDLAPESDYVSYFFPTLVSSFLEPKAQISYSYACPSTNLQLWITDKGRRIEKDSIYSIEWKIEDSTYSNLSPTHLFKEAGNRKVQAHVVWMNHREELITKNIYISQPWKLDLGKDTTLCGSQTLRLDVSAIGGISTWQDGSTSSFYQVDKPGKYWVKVCKNGCSAIDSITVSYKDFPKIDLGKDLTICHEEAVSLSVDTTFDNIIWSTGATKSTIEINQSGRYWVQVQNECGLAADTILITYENGPELNLGLDTLICAGETLLLNAYHPHAVSYLWQGVPGISTLEVTTEGMYVAEIRNKNCIAKDSIYVQVIECSDKMKIPNVFTPNGDGKNDRFEVQGILPNKWSLIISNRLGKVVYQSDAYNHEWDAEGQATGMYYYYLLDPSSQKRFKGWVHVIR